MRLLAVVLRLRFGLRLHLLLLVPAGVRAAVRRCPVSAAAENPVSPALLDELADVLALHGVELTGEQRAALDADLRRLGVFAAEFTQAVLGGLRARLEERPAE